MAISTAVVPVSIVINESLSAAVDLRGMVPCGIIMPAGWTAASLTFQASHDENTYNNLYDNGTEVIVAASTAQYILLRPSDWSIGITKLKIRSGTAGTPVAQVAARTLYLVLASY